MKLTGKIITIFTCILVIFSTFVSLLIANGVRVFFEDQVKANITEMSRLGLSYIEAEYPGEWEVRGDSLYKGNTQVNDNPDFVSLFASEAGCHASVYLNDVAVSTTVTDDDGKMAAGMQASPEITEKVLKNGQDYLGEALTTTGAYTIASYTPIRDGSGNIIGMWSVGYDKQLVNENVMEYLKNIWIVQTVGLLVAVLLVFVLAMKMIKPLKHVTSNLKQMTEGKFDLEIKDTDRKDEIGDIVRASRAMQRTTHGMVKTIREESETIDGVLAETVRHMEELKKEMEAASATTQQFSAGVQETAASLEEMNAASAEIEAAVENMAKKAEEGSQTAEEIKKRAADLRQKAIDSKNSAMELLERTQNELARAIERSKSIEQIQQLTAAILQIASQTNLLSLNAAIEASRAGEYGAGFAVVAEQIRKLAEDSKKTVGEIQQVALTVTETVNDLVKSSKDILAFISERVVNDYDGQVMTGEQYDRDAQYISGMMLDISATSEQLNASISNMMKAIGDVSRAANDGATNAAELAEMASRVVDKGNSVLQIAEKANRSVETLKAYVENLKV